MNEKKENGRRSATFIFCRATSDFSCLDKGQNVVMIIGLVWLGLVVQQESWCILFVMSSRCCFALVDLTHFSSHLTNSGSDSEIRTFCTEYYVCRYALKKWQTGIYSFCRVPLISSIFPILVKLWYKYLLIWTVWYIMMYIFT